MAVGPNTPGFVANRELAEQLAEVGVILLMFGEGLHFHFKELLAVRRLRDQGVAVVYGDARHRETLKSAGVSAAASLNLSASSIGGVE